jgi:hypothetical protein
MASKATAPPKGKEHSEEGKEGKEGVEELPADCMVCCETFNASDRARVACPFCPTSRGTACCRCAETYLLGSVQDPHCMQCKHVWSLHFFVGAFSRRFVTSTYRKDRQTKSLEREKGMLGEAMEELALRGRERDKDAEIAEIEREIALLRVQIGRKTLERRAIRNPNVLGLDDDDEGDGGHGWEDAGDLLEKVPTKKEKAVRYTFACPEGDCRGLIEATSLKCAVCDTKICSRCHVKVEGKPTKRKATKKDEEDGAEYAVVEEETVDEKPKAHTCKKEDVETARAINKETKPCPKCAGRIYRIDGCDQMFCTACRTPFSWKTGEVVTGVIHNPHYYALQRQLGREERTPGDEPPVAIVCGRIPDMYTVTRAVARGRDVPQRKLEAVHRLVGEVNDYLRGLGNGALQTLDLRIEYALNRIDDATLRKKVFVRERQVQKRTESANVLDTFRTTMTERLNDMLARCLAVDPPHANDTFVDNRAWERAKRPALPLKEALEIGRLVTSACDDADKVIQYCNAALESNLALMGFTAGPCLILGTTLETNISFSKAREVAARYADGRKVKVATPPRDARSGKALPFVAVKQHRHDDDSDSGSSE